MSKRNEKILAILNDWDPFGYGKGAYEAEIAEVLQAIHELEEPGAVAKRIRETYEYAFDESLSLDECLKVATAVVLARETTACDIGPSRSVCE